MSYVKTGEWQVDFLANAQGQESLLIQVCADTTSADTMRREMRALERAREAHPEARALLVTLDSRPPNLTMGKGIRWCSAARWLLER